MNRSFIFPALFSASLLLYSCGGETTTTTPSGDSTKTTTEEKKPDAMSSASSDAPKRYGIEKGKVVYSYTGMQKGTETMWFSDWG